MMKGCFCPDCGLSLDTPDSVCLGNHTEPATLRRQLQNVRDLVKSQEEELAKAAAEVDKLRCQVEAMQVEIDGYAKFNAAAETEIAWLRTGIRDFLCECALVEDFHRNYEVWQITKGSMVELRELLEKKS